MEGYPRRTFQVNPNGVWVATLPVAGNRSKHPSVIDFSTCRS